MTTIRKAQSAIEFVILVGAVFFFFIIFLFAIQSNISDKIRENLNLAVQEIALTVQDEINLASESSDGYYRKFNIPEKVINLDYEINVTEGLVYVRTSNGKYAIVLPVADVSGEIQKGDNVIRKESGAVSLNE
ncbi:MAG: hypothetical protein IIA87_03125 [Nanoarchaeota archaeon]|nr:hypothetical protein [Nanoarchaeota archaeon]